MPIKPCSCGSFIDFVRLKTGKSMPVEPDYHQYDESEPGTVLVTDAGEVFIVAKDTSVPGMKGRYPHFGNCAHATAYRRAR